jgi:tetratricopeptide (TPR) repeat protein
MASQVTDRVVFLETWRVAAEEVGRRHGEKLLELPPSEWHTAMAADSSYRSYGALVFLIDQVYSDLSERPSSARELALTVTAFVDEVETPDTLYRERLRGRAWKELANALRVTGDMRGALMAADRAVDILAHHHALGFDHAVAELAKAQVLQHMDRSDEAIGVARRCAAVFKAHGDSEYYGRARMTEAWVLFARRQIREAMQIFVDRVAEAEASGDTLNLARALQCTGACARELGDLQAARDFFARSLARYEQFGTSVVVEVQKVRWSYALLLAAEGNSDEAVHELERVENELLRLGSNAEAANASIEIVRLRFARGEDVSRQCSRLVLTFANAGMAQNAIEPLAYMREQARTGRLSLRKLDRVSSFFRELPRNPRLAFLRPPEEEP